mmetsp:Transcript_58262/g.127756  ORF Transcript_58262/g.127756 Transcript_58262/m.127756 type:complete len:102 (+) Transcript_58262:1438-1743(+)
MGWWKSCGQFVESLWQATRLGSAEERSPECPCLGPCGELCMSLGRGPGCWIPWFVVHSLGVGTAAAACCCAAGTPGRAARRMGAVVVDHRPGTLVRWGPCP